MNTKKGKQSVRDLESERDALLKEMSKHISRKTKQGIKSAVNAMSRSGKYQVKVSHEGAGNADIE